MAEQNRTRFTTQVIQLIRSIPEGRVSTYGEIADLAGNPRAARQVARILHSCSENEKLPWHRVINSKGRISLEPMYGYEEQKQLLEEEGIVFDETDTVDLSQYLWVPDIGDLAEFDF